MPSLTYQETPNRLSIRGVGRFDNSLGVSPGVAIYNDGIFTAEATSLSTQPMHIPPTPQRFMAAEMDSKAAAGAPPIEIGESQIRFQVTVTYEIE